MKVILLQDVPKVGKKDQVLEAKEGYARNYLFPKKLAVEATPANMKELQRQEKIRADKAAAQKAEAIALGEKLKEITVTMQVKCGAGGRLF
ncbi:MAG: 50S ribosomal protein L9, partial [Peptococcaceae bacterium]|nr:50S ribosomal protein L9 [Peptococcaceae bacterium]